ncbi:MAG: type I-E CRISPR-associated protein Cse1/CasA [Anaerolineaceae bacterium]|jgi:CRISPR system Cascade subunit CasA|nr:type I-E CRISPR-associated protein Cse1/CasA [Anaerolineaceae bacterium]MDY0280582.1 type I-E CRISPR-associated protein Cse1/CasA [Salinivirgaceae bacterium]
MESTFNLLEESWIPCVDMEGRPIELSLSETLLKAHQLREIAASSPLATGAIYRLLLAILHRNFGPESMNAWGQLWESSQWDQTTLQAYFEKWHHRFYLFDDEHPFYQSTHFKANQQPISQLVPQYSSGNNATLFDHHVDDDGASLSPAEAAQALVTIQSFGISGTNGLKRKPFTDAPCTRGILFLLAGKNLFETLALNLLQYNKAEPLNNLSCTPQHQYTDETVDKPSWEMEDPFDPDRTMPTGYLDYLTWQNRRVLLEPEESENGEIIVPHMLWEAALRLDSSVLDPMKHYFVDDKGISHVLRFYEGGAVWRDSSALFAARTDTNYPPMVFKWANDLTLYGFLEKDLFQSVALGMANFQSKIFYFREEQFDLPSTYLKDETLVDELFTQLDYAKQTGKKLWGATQSFAALLLSPESDTDDSKKPDPKNVKNLVNRWGIDHIYWAGLEVPFYRLMDALPKNRLAAIEAWETTSRRQASFALDEAIRIAGNKPAAMKAGAKASRQLYFGVKNIWPDKTKEEK